MLQLTRRAALLGLTSAFAIGRTSLALAAAPTEQRFVVVILRGALLGAGKLLENRDLQPTRDLRAVAKGLLAQHLGLGAEALATVFPDSATVQPMAGLIRT